MSMIYKVLTDNTNTMPVSYLNWAINGGDNAPIVHRTTQKVIDSYLGTFEGSIGFGGVAAEDPRAHAIEMAQIAQDCENCLYVNVLAIDTQWPTRDGYHTESVYAHIGALQAALDARRYERELAEEEQA